MIHRRAAELSRAHGRQVVSGLPAARRLRRDEPRPPLHSRTGTSSRTWCAAIVDRRRAPPRASTTNTTPCSTCRPSTTSTPSRTVFQSTSLPRGTWDVDGQRVAPARHPQDRAVDDRGRTRRHLRPRPDRSRACAVHGHQQVRDKQHLTVEGAGHYGIFQRPPLARRSSIRKCAHSSSGTCRRSARSLRASASTAPF